jgi:hypothetical protein
MCVSGGALAQPALLGYFIALCIKLFINFAKVHKAAVAGGGDSHSCPSLPTHLGIKDY